VKAETELLQNQKLEMEKQQQIEAELKYSEILREIR